MKNNMKICLFGMLIILVVAFLIVAGLEKASVAFLDYENDRYEKEYIAGEKGVSSPWYRDGLHIVDEGFIDELSYMKKSDRSVVSIGSSLSIISFQSEEAKLPEEYDYHFLVCGNGSWKSDGILYSLAKEAEAISEDDIIKLEMSFSTFRDVETTITESTLNKWKRYKVLDDGRVKKMPFPGEYVSCLNDKLLRIQNSWEILSDLASMEQAKLKGQLNYETVIPGNFRNNYFNYDAVAGSCHMNNEMQEYMEDLVVEISDNHMLVVELSPIPQGLLETEYGKDFNLYIDKEFIPFLDREGIKYLDYRYDYSDDEYADGVHLNYNAGVKYTNKLNMDLKDIIENSNE